MTAYPRAAVYTLLQCVDDCRPPLADAVQAVCAYAEEADKEIQRLREACLSKSSFNNLGTPHVRFGCRLCQTVWYDDDTPAHDDSCPIAPVKS